MSVDGNRDESRAESGADNSQQEGTRIGTKEDSRIGTKEDSRKADGGAGGSTPEPRERLRDGT